MAALLKKLVKTVLFSGSMSCISCLVTSEPSENDLYVRPALAKVWNFVKTNQGKMPLEFHKWNVQRSLKRPWGIFWSRRNVCKTLKALMRRKMPSGAKLGKFRYSNVFFLRALSKIYLCRQISQYPCLCTISGTNPGSSLSVTLNILCSSGELRLSLISTIFDVFSGSRFY